MEGLSTRITVDVTAGRYQIRSLQNEEERTKAFRLRFQVFQIELIGQSVSGGLDQDEFDSIADHFGIFEVSSQELVGTCRLNCSLFTDRFYSSTEFSCASLLELPGTKVELGRVCLRPDVRRGVVLLLLWRGLAEYLKKANAKYLFGCGSVMTESPEDASLIWRLLLEDGHVRSIEGVEPLKEYSDSSFESLAKGPLNPLTDFEREKALMLLPPLCKSYFDMGCFVPGPPAFDRKFRCVDFLTVLEVQSVSDRLKRKVLGSN